MQSMYEQDWILRQIKLMTAAIAKILFGKDTAVYEIIDYRNKTQTDELHLSLLRLIGEGKINEAEDLLFQALSPNDPDALLLALDFYQRLNAFSDDELKRMDFSRREIHEGLRDLQQLCGLDLG